MQYVNRVFYIQDVNTYTPNLSLTYLIGNSHRCNQYNVYLCLRYVTRVNVILSAVLINM